MKIYQRNISQGKKWKMQERILLGTRHGWQLISMFFIDAVMEGNVIP